MTGNIGKHLFLALIVIVLLIGIYISINSASFRLNSTEHFYNPPTETTVTTAAPTISPALLYPAPVNFRILNISPIGIDVSFNPPPTPTGSAKLKHYNIIIASMDSKGTVINSQRMFLQPINTCIIPDIPDTTLPSNQQLQCSYNIPITAGANEETFKAGLMAIYDTGSSQIIDPQDTLKVFKLGLSVAKNIDIFNAGQSAIKALQQSNTNILSGSSNQNMLGTADGQFQLISQSLGGYPNNLYVSQETGADTLTQAANKQLSLGIVNVNVNAMP
jgi:hypothetical protein